MVHFPPFFSGIDDTLKLVDQLNLVEGAKQAGVGHIFCGHTHEYRIYPAPGYPVEVHCGGTTAQYCAPIHHPGDAGGNCFDEIAIEVLGTSVTRAVTTKRWFYDRALNVFR
jgi:hypothetical protein